MQDNEKIYRIELTNKEYEFLENLKYKKFKMVQGRFNVKVQSEICLAVSGSRRFKANET